MCVWIETEEQQYQIKLNSIIPSLSSPPWHWHMHLLTPTYHDLVPIDVVDELCNPIKTNKEKKHQARAPAERNNPLLGGRGVLVRATQHADRAAISSAPGPHHF